MRGAMMLAALAAASPAAGATFAVVGTISGGPVIGSFHGTTLYGVVPYGGDGNGSLFSMDATGAVTTLHNFAAGTDGDGLAGRLVRSAAGDLTGVAIAGGANSSGTLWRYSAAGAFSVLHAFGAIGDGDTPLQGPVTDAAGDIFGTTSGGAVATNGLAFRLTAQGAYISLHNFLSGADGHCPFSGAARGPYALLYGTTVGNGFGGDSNGSVWKITPQGQLVTLHVFTDGSDGEWPRQTPLVDHGGTIYGTTSVQNGKAFDGALWRITRAGAFSVLHSFVAATDGAQPNSPLITDGRGTLFGTTATGGPGGHGTLFSITTSGVLTVLHAFANGSDGGTPTGNLVLNGSHVIFGGTQSGQVFSVTP